MARKELDNKVSIITGASVGIGRAIAQVFAREGSSLVLVSRNKDALEETTKLCVAEGLDREKILILTSDISKNIEEACKNIIKQTIDKFGRLDVLVNNAGIMPLDTIFTFTGPSLSAIKSNPSSATGTSSEAGAHSIFERFDEIMDTNVRGPLALIHFAIDHLVASKGNVVNVSSVAGLRAMSGILSYCMSKAALDQLTRCAALDLGPKGVRVNSVNPGATRTDLMVNGGVPPEKAKEFFERQAPLYPLGRVAEPIEVAEAVLFLASSRSSFCSGVTLPIDSGRSNTVPR